MKLKKLLCSVSLILCLTLVFSVSVFAEEIGFVETNKCRYVDDIDEYLTQLNEGLIIPVDTTITTYDSPIATYGVVSDPSKSCSNIFGHKWGSWSSWEQTEIVHRKTGYCTAVIKRKRECKRTHCGAYQTEVDTVNITCH